MSRCSVAEDRGDDHDDDGAPPQQQSVSSWWLDEAARHRVVQQMAAWKRRLDALEVENATLRRVVRSRHLDGEVASAQRALAAGVARDARFALVQLENEHASRAVDARAPWSICAQRVAKQLREPAQHFPNAVRASGAHAVVRTVATNSTFAPVFELRSLEAPELSAADAWARFCEAHRLSADVGREMARCTLRLAWWHDACTSVRESDFVARAINNGRAGPVTVPSGGCDGSAASVAHCLLGRIAFGPFRIACLSTELGSRMRRARFCLVASVRAPDGTVLLEGVGLPFVTTTRTRRV
jgi:hypothetical protein